MMHTNGPVGTVNPSDSLDIKTRNVYHARGYVARSSWEGLMGFIATIREDIRAVKQNDPAAQSGLVIFLSYPGLHAKWMHTPEHWLWSHSMRGPARVISQITRHFTVV